MNVEALCMIKAAAPRYLKNMKSWDDLRKFVAGLRNSKLSINGLPVSPTSVGKMQEKLETASAAAQRELKRKINSAKDVKGLKADNSHMLKKIEEGIVDGSLKQTGFTPKSISRMLPGYLRRVSMDSNTVDDFMATMQDRLKVDRVDKIFSKMDQLPNAVVRVPRSAVTTAKTLRSLNHPRLSNKQLMARSGGVVNPKNTVFKGSFDPEGVLPNGPNIFQDVTPLSKQLLRRSGGVPTGKDFFASVRPNAAMDYASGRVVDSRVGPRDYAGILDSYDAKDFVYKLRQGTRSANSPVPASVRPADVWSWGLTGNSPDAVALDSLRDNFVKRKWYKQYPNLPSVNELLTTEKDMRHTLARDYETVLNFRDGIRPQYRNRWLATGGGDAIQDSPALRAQIEQARNAAHQTRMQEFNKDPVPRTLLRKDYVNRNEVDSALNSMKNRFSFDW